jgi:hypothetical protein
MRVTSARGGRSRKLPTRHLVAVGSHVSQDYLYANMCRSVEMTGRCEDLSAHECGRSIRDRRTAWCTGVVGVQLLHCFSYLLIACSVDAGDVGWEMGGVVSIGPW